MAKIYDRSARKVFGLALNIARDPCIAAGITQDVYLQIWREAHRYDPDKASGLTWLLLVAHRRSIDTIRSSESSWGRETQYLALLARYEPDTNLTVRSAESSAEARRARAALRLLPSLQREAIELAYFGGWTSAEIACVTGTIEETVKTWIRDGLKRLLQILDS